MSLFEPDRPRLDIPAVGRKVYDVTRRGTVVATLALGLAAGASLEDASWIANHAAGQVIRDLGTATVTRAEILASWSHAQ